MKKRAVLLIGLGNQMTKDHIPALMRRDDVAVTGVIDININLAKEIANELSTDYFSSTDEAVQSSNFDFAIVSVPHNAYWNILTILAKSKIPTLKEKPLAIDLIEAERVLDLFKREETYLQICVQRRFSKLYETCKSLIERLENIHSVYADYTLNLMQTGKANLNWRSDLSICGGGVTLDLGYHLIDIVNYLFCAPGKVYAQLNCGESTDHKYGLDHSMKAMFRCGKINANIFSTISYHRKGERMRIYGTNGYVAIDDRTVSLFDNKSQILETHTFADKEHEVDRQLDYFIKNLSANLTYDPMLERHIENMRVIDAIYKSHSKNEVTYAI